MLMTIVFSDVIATRINETSGNFTQTKIDCRLDCEVKSSLSCVPDAGRDNYINNLTLQSHAAADLKIIVSLLFQSVLIKILIKTTCFTRLIIIKIFDNVNNNAILFS